MIILFLTFAFAKAVSEQEFNFLVDSDSGAYGCLHPDYAFGKEDCTTIDSEHMCRDTFHERCRAAFASRGRVLPPPTPEPPFKTYNTGGLGIADEADKPSAEATDAKATPKSLPEKESSEGDRRLSDTQVRRLYGDFSSEQIPSQAKVGFKEWAIPKGSKCANTREQEAGGQKIKCTACAEGAMTEVRRLGTYTLDRAEVGRNAVYMRSSYVLHLQGSNGEVTLTCTPIAAFETMTDVITKLKAFKIGFSFPYPKEATLRPKAGTEAPTTSF